MNESKNISNYDIILLPYIAEIIASDKLTDDQRELQLRAIFKFRSILKYYANRRYLSKLINANGASCAFCGDVENGFMEYTCNARTHGMEKYNHKDFQMVIQYSDENIRRILNTFGLWVQQGRTFKDGDEIEGIFEDCTVRLNEFEETGRKVLRVIIPDKNNVFPEDKKCLYPYSVQNKPTEMLMKKGGAEL